MRGLALLRLMSLMQQAEINRRLATWAAVLD
jgi:hypothetical protein